MKKYCLLLLISLIAGSAGKICAQSTAYAPYAGATHTYTVSGLASGDSYTFYLSTDANGINKSNVVSDAGTIVSPNGTIGADGTATTKINWASDVASKYGTNGLYLFIAVTSNASSGSCSNYRDVKIVPVANIFSTTLTDVTGSSTPGSASGPLGNPSCPDLNTAEGFQPVSNSGTVSDGRTILIFRVNRNNSTNAWKFNLGISCSLTTTTYTYSIQGKATSSLGAGTTTPSGGADVNCASGDDYALVSIIVDNKQGDAPVFTVTVNSAQDVITNTPDLTAPRNVIHTIEKLPVIGTFSGN